MLRKYDLEADFPTMSESLNIIILCNITYLMRIKLLTMYAKICKNSGMGLCVDSTFTIIHFNCPPDLFRSK